MIQSSARKVTLICLQSNKQHDIQITTILKGLHMGEKYLALWDDQQVSIFNFFFHKFVGKFKKKKLFLII